MSAGHRTSGYMMSIWLVNGDVSLDHLVSWVLLGFPTIKSLFFPFPIDIYLGRDTLELYTYPVYPQTFGVCLMAMLHLPQSF